MDNIINAVNYIRKVGLYPDMPIITSGVNEPLCVINGKRYLMFCSNNYLGMTENRYVKNAAKKSIDKYGVGPGGSRVISGNVDIIEELEKSIANLTGTEDCITFPTGYMANIGVFKAVMDSFVGKDNENENDNTIFSDEDNHGSIVDGCRLSKAKKIVFKHNNTDDLIDKLRNNESKNKLIVTEGVFSLDGEIVNLPKYIEIAKNYGAKIMIDDAHGVGILGRNGGGTGEYYNCVSDINILMGCMDKALGGTGGFLCGSKILIDYLRISCRSSVLSSAIPTMMAGAMIKSISLIKKGDKIRKDLLSKAEYLKMALIKSGFRILGKDTIPAIPLFIGDEIIGIKFSKLLWEDGIYLPIVRWPAVSMKECRFRIIIMANHSKEQLDRLVKACVNAGEKLNIIKSHNII
ncbi:MAG: 8-amino-7-oxononanoate synthase [Candidatus Kerfeldbacteria bacterium CG_4_10_14_0_8_um_filter_42_10]|uniref:8-amino-7-oxononanoate synthase n=1 Tax=Candidatus Kerfeldbacteria bacterium CG_4_10_14_0_8_um_filter_42_10 TaxID=2014248 RepID=A0A2M7RIQ1_9BACT|nr:MAG: 8-amino-7-oxononanoate synthase [Candidatus Kerfeldbacteria bacterium CG_4_10_14_0_8_um_filter_42_10]